MSDLLDELCLDNGDETGIDCILDKMQLGLSQVSIHDGIRREIGVKVGQIPLYFLHLWCETNTQFQSHCLQNTLE